MAADVARRDDVMGVVDDVVSSHGRVDVLCNNAGILIDALVLDITEEQLDQALDVASMTHP